MQPLLIGDSLGWLHTDASVRPRIAVLLCAALGRDARCLYRPQRLFADALAKAGFPTLRFDYPGEGDSGDIPLSADALPRWLSAIESCKQRVKAETGVEHIVIGGFRIGAALASLAADDVEGLMLLGPVTDAKAWIAKHQFTSRRRQGEDAVKVDMSLPLDAEGLSLSAATLKSLTTVNLARSTAASPRVLVASNGLSTHAAETRLRDQGAEIVKIPFEGYEDLFLDPNVNQPPLKLFGAMIDWLKTVPASRNGDEPPSHFAARGQQPAQLAVDGGVETTTQFGDGLWGVLCRPERSVNAIKTAVIFLNTGGDPRAGIGRFAVANARQLARRGVWSLRFDFSGLGDSPPPPGEETVHVYETPRRAEIAAALARLREEGCSRFFLVGVSAGAYHALRAIIADADIEGAICISPLKLVWRRGDSLAIGERRWGKSTAAYKREAVSARTWLRLLRGEVNVKLVANTMMLRLLARLSPEHRTFESRALQAELAAVSARGGLVQIIAGTEDAALDELEDHFGKDAKRFTKLTGAKLSVVEDMDHGLVYQRSRDAASSHLMATLADRGCWPR